MGVAEGWVKGWWWWWAKKRVSDMYMFQMRLSSERKVRFVSACGGACDVVGGPLREKCYCGETDTLWWAERGSDFTF